MKTRKQWTKKFLSIILCIAMLLTYIPNFSFTAFSAETAAYDGTPVTPTQITESNYRRFGLTDSNWSAYNGYYGICNAKELYGFAALVNGGSNSINAVLLQDIVVNAGTITASGSPSGTTYDWSPIGTSSKPYQGTFDGNGCTISGLYYNQDNDNISRAYLGLFNFTQTGANIKNLILANTYFHASAYIGGIVSVVNQHGTTISNCKIAEDVTIVADISSEYLNTGGIVGSYVPPYSILNWKGTNTIKNCVNLGKIVLSDAEFDISSNHTWFYSGAIAGKYREENNAYKHIEAQNCFCLNNCLTDKNGVNKTYSLGGTFNTVSSGGCTWLTSTTDSHTCVSVTHKEVTATCMYPGLSEYSFCLICGKITNGTKKATGIAAHTYEGATCNNHGVCTICGDENGPKKPEVHSGWYEPTCIAPKTCIGCGAKEGNKDADNHTSTELTYTVHQSDNAKHDVLHKCCGAYVETIAHSSYDAKGACVDCKYQCTHPTWTQGICDICNYICPHLNIENNKCSACGEEGTIPYINREWNAATEMVEESVKLAPSNTQVITSTTVQMTDGWYIAESDTSISEKINVIGTSHLILADGATLNAQKGISIEEGGALYIYAQSSAEDTMGKLNAKGYSYYGAGIYGTVIINGGAITANGYGTNREGINSSNGTVTINGGMVTATGGDYAAGMTGSITINGGTVTATGKDYAAGIGGSDGDSGGTITINGGTVTAIGGFQGAGIGSGDEGTSGGTITINGGTIYATAGNDGAGIGGGESSPGGTIVITGGTVYANGSYSGAGIGGGCYSSVGTITITGGTVSASSTGSGAGIGGGHGGKGSDVVITGGNIKATGYTTIGAGKNATGGTLTDGTNLVSLIAITLDGVNEQTAITKVEGIGNYGLNDVYTIDHDKLYFYLPTTSNPTSVTAGGREYEGAVENGVGTFYSHQHSWTYELDGTDTIKATCTTADCTLQNGNGGSVKLNVNNAYYTGEAVKATAQGSFTSGATYKITYNNGSETTPSSVGTHEATLTVSEDGNEKQSVTLEYTISYLPTPESAYYIEGYTYKDSHTYWFKNGASITVNAPNGYTISKTLNDSYASSVTFSESDSKVIYLKNSSGEMTTTIAIIEMLSFDHTNPDGKIEIVNRGFWAQLLNKITFNLFFKGDTVANVTAEDAGGSGIQSIEYYLAGQDLVNDDTLDYASAIAKLENSIGENWNSYSNAIPINKNAKNVIYVKITDNVGNVTYLNSEGIVLYADAEADTESISTTYKAAKDEDISIKLNGNTVNSVVNGMTTLIAGTDYTLNGNIITMKADYLNTLNAGTYTFTVSYNPLGLTYVNANGNDEPGTTTFKIHVGQADGVVTNISDISKTYDGTAVASPSYDTISTGVATIEYKDKNAEDNTYTTEAPKNAGDYMVRVTVTADANYKEASDTKEFTIKRATLTNVSVEQDGILAYNKEPQRATVKTSATTVDGATVYYNYGTDNVHFADVPLFTDSGSYTVHYRAFTTDGNYDVFKGSFTINIDKQTVIEPTVESKPYNGSQQTADIIENDIYTVEKNEGGTSKGSYDVVLKLKDTDNYKWSTTDNAEVTVPFAISATENSWTIAPSIHGWTYGGQANTPVYAAKYGTVKVVYTGSANDGSDWNSESAPTKAGSYTATFIVDGTEDYSSLSEAVNFNIAKADYDMSSAKWNYTDAFMYDGKVHTVEVIGLPNGVTVSDYAENTATVTGNYTAKVTLNYDSNNYNRPAVTNLNWSIVNNWTPTEYTVSTPNNNGWLNQDFVITAKEGFKVSLTNTAEGIWSDTLSYTENTDNGSVTFYVKNDTNGTISLAKTINYKLDGVAPTGKIEFDERSSWESFVNTITFGRFYKDEVTVKAQGTDNLSGVVSIKYLASDKAMTLDEVKAVSDSNWTTYTGNIGVTLEDAKQFVYYIRIVDNAGNVSYLSTDGAEYDITAPVISGIENGKTYYTTQKVTIIDMNLDTVTLNGEAANDITKLEGNKDATHVIVATDKAGNTTTVTVTTKPVEDITDVTAENVKPEDKTELEQAKDVLKKSLEENGNNYTEDEKKAIEDKIKQIDDALAELNKLATSTSPDTGDSSNLWLWLALIFVSGVGIFRITLSNRKRRIAKNQ